MNHQELREEFFDEFSSLPDRENLQEVADWWIERIKKLIIGEMKIAREEGQPTSRLTSLYNKLNEKER